MIASAGFNPLHSEAERALVRLRQFHRLVAQHSARYFPTLVMNDGAAAYRDLSFRHRSVGYDFLARAWNLFSDINSAETKQSFPGVRLVLAVGFRMRGRRAGIDASSAHLQSIIRRYEADELTADEAIREATSVRQPFDIIPQLQANFAFTKAYLAEASGTVGGFSGPNFFIDLSLFESPPPPWLVIDSPFDWAHPKLGLKTSFAHLIDLPRWTHVERGPLGILDGLEVAKRQTRDPNVLRALRTASKTVV